MTAVKADIGDRVEAGAVLAELGIPELEDEGRQKAALVDRAKANVEQAKKQVTIAEANVVVAEAQAAEAAAGVKRADAVYARWESEAKRVGEMVRTRVVDPQTGDETTNQFRAAEAARDEARARATAAGTLAGKAKAELGKATEDVKVAEAEESGRRRGRPPGPEPARLPADQGPVRRHGDARTVDPGTSSRPWAGRRPSRCSRSSSTDTVRVGGRPEADAPLIRKGAKAIVRIPALKGAEFTGTVSRASERQDSLPGPSGRDRPAQRGRSVRPGMFANVRIVERMPRRGLPAAAVLKQADQTVVFLARDGNAVRLTVQPGRTDGTSPRCSGSKGRLTRSMGRLTGTEEVSPARSRR